MAASRQIPTSLSTPPVGGGTALDRIQEELTKLYDQSRLMCENEANVSDAYTADVLPALTASLVDGMGFVFKCPATNSGSSTMSLNAGAAKTFVDRNGTALKAGMLRQDAFYEFVYDASSDKFVLIGHAIGVIGKRHLFVPSNQMYGRTTSGAATGTTETTTNKVMVQTLDFDNTTQEFAQFVWAPPANYNNSTLTAKFVWLHPSTTVNYGVRWGIQALARSDDDALDTAFGTEQNVSDTGGTTTDVYISAECPAMTPSGTPADGDLLIFQINRNPGHADDNLGVDAKLIGVILFWNSDHTVEA